MFTFLLLVPANQVAIAINRNENAVDASTELLSIWNWLAVFIGGLLVALVVFATFLPSFPD